MPCSIIGESDEHVRIRLGCGWELALLKTSILAVEEDDLAGRNWIN
jgi:hypothetical protein